MALAVSVLTGRRRSFRGDALAAVAQLTPEAVIVGAEGISPPCLITVNHYTRRGLPAWWLAFAVSAALPFEIHWVITAAWRFPGRFIGPPATAISRRVLRLIAATYGFTAMPAMPPLPGETAARATAVRRALAYARSVPNAAVGLAPEGGDFAGPGGVTELPEGAGRFIMKLAGAGLTWQPAALFEEGDRLHLHFGAAENFNPPDGLAPHALDAWARDRVRRRLLALLPQSL